MWSHNEISKQEKQRDIFAYITLLFFQIKKGSLSTVRFYGGDIYFYIHVSNFEKKLQKSL